MHFTQMNALNTEFKEMNSIHVRLGTILSKYTSNLHQTPFEVHVFGDNDKVKGADPQPHLCSR